MYAARAVNDLSLRGFQHAIKALHGAHSRFVKRVRVEEAIEDERVWGGEVLVFGLIDHPCSHECYAWELGGEVTAILHDEAVRSAQDAVRTAIDGFNLQASGRAIGDERR